jgi:hypothetical protein
MRNLKLQWAFDPTAPRTRHHRISLSKMIHSYTVQLGLEAACTLDPGVYVCIISQCILWYSSRIGSRDYYYTGKDVKITRT